MMKRISGVRLTLLALASATAILAFPPTTAFAAKIAAPAAKPLVMGTPAQLVQDLKTAGVDLANMQVIRPELLKEAVKTTSGTRDVWTISSAEIYTDSKSGELELIQCYYEKGADKASLYPMVSLSPGLVGGKDSLYKRYGQPHKETKCASYNGYTYTVLFQQGDVSLWNCSFGYAPNGNAFFSAGLLGEHFNEVMAKYDGSKVTYTGKRSALYNDLAAMGFAPGMLSSRPETLAQGKVDPSSPRTRSFENCSVSVDNDDRIRVFLLFEYKGGLLSSITRAIINTGSGLEPWPSGEFSKTLRLGKSAVLSRYGAPDKAPADSDTIFYYALLRDGSRLVPVELRFEFMEGKGPTENMAAGKVISQDCYLVSGP